MAEFSVLAAHMPSRAFSHDGVLWQDRGPFPYESRIGACQAGLAANLIAALCAVDAPEKAKKIFDVARTAGITVSCSTLRVLTEVLLTTGAPGTVCALLNDAVQMYPASLEVDLLVAKTLSTLLCEPTTQPLAAVYEVVRLWVLTYYGGIVPAWLKPRLLAALGDADTSEAGRRLRQDLLSRTITIPGLSSPGAANPRCTSSLSAHLSVPPQRLA